MAGKRQTLHRAATATADGAPFNVMGWATTIFQVTGTFTGTITFEATIDGTNWEPIQVANKADGAVATTATTTGLYETSTAGLGDVRARISAYTSGNITVTARGVSEGAGLSIADVDIAAGETTIISDITSIATIAGQKAMLASFPVVVASDQSSLTVDQATHDSLNANANLQVADTDVGAANPVPVGSAGITISQIPTVTAGAYVANDAVGGLLTFANAARVSGGGGVIKDVVIIDDAGQDVALELWLFDQTFTAMADNAAWAPAEADLENLVAIITTDDGAWFAAGTPSAALIEVSQRYDCTGTSLFGQLVTRGTPTFVATDDVTVKIGLLQD